MFYKKANKCLGMLSRHGIRIRGEMKTASDTSQIPTHHTEDNSSLVFSEEYYEIAGITICGEKLYTKNPHRIDTIACLLDVAEVEFSDLSDNDGLTKTVIRPLKDLW